MNDRLLEGTEIRHLATLVAIAAEGSLADAARELGCQPSTLRHRIASLERSAGTPLLRGGRRWGSDSLTDAGRVLLAHAQEVMARVAAAQAAVESVARSESFSARIAG